MIDAKIFKRGHIMKKKIISFALTCAFSLCSCKLLQVVRLKGGSIMNVEVHTAFVDPGVSYPTGIYSMTSSGDVDVDTLGSYEITYAFANTKGIVKRTITRLVNVVDTTAPTPTQIDTLPTLYAGFSYNGSIFATATDNYDDPSDIIFDDVVMRKAGPYEIYVKMYDTSGNIAVLGRTVNVEFDGYALIEHAYEDDPSKVDDHDSGGLVYRQATIDENTKFLCYSDGDLDYQKKYACSFADSFSLTISSQYGGFDNADLMISANTGTSFYVVFINFDIHQHTVFNPEYLIPVVHSLELVNTQVAEFVNARINLLAQEMINYFSTFLNLDI